jgi:hypothetical protein
MVFFTVTPLFYALLERGAFKGGGGVRRRRGGGGVEDSERERNKTKTNAKTKTKTRGGGVMVTNKAFFFSNVLARLDLVLHRMPWLGLGLGMRLD